jgi:MFS family permease
MLKGVGAAPSAGTLVAAAYAMFFGGLLMFGSRLGDRLGHRRTIACSLALFGIGAVAAATATNVVLLTAARCLQGGAAAAAVPSALRLLTTVARPERRARALAAWSATGAAAGASGFVLGGLVTAAASWRVVFAVLVVVAALLLVAVLRWVPADEVRDSSLGLNVAASALLTLDVMAVVTGATVVIDPAGRMLGVALLGIAVILFPAFVAVDRRSAAPLLPRSLVRRSRVRRGAVGSFMNTACTSSVATLVTLYIQDTLGYDALTAAATLLPFSLAVIAGAGAAAPVLVRMRSEVVAAAGLAFVALGDALLVLAAPSLAAVGGCMALAGFGIGMSSVATTSMSMDVPEGDRAAASGVVNTTAQLGTAIGVAGLLLLAAFTSGIPGKGTSAPTAAWGAAAVAAVVVAAVLVSLKPTSKSASAKRRSLATNSAVE